MSSARRNAAVVAVLAAVVVAGYAVTWSGVSRAQMGTSDFSAFYVGGTLARTGHLHDLYSDAAQSAVHAGLVAPLRTANLAFVNPPPAALLMAPVSLLPFATAYRAWVALQLLLLLAGLLIAARAAPWSAAARTARAPLVAALAGFAGTGTLALGLLGQWDGLSALGLAAAYALWRRDRALAGGAVLAVSAAIAKPHLAIGLAALLLGWRERRVIAGAAAGAAAVALVALLEVGVGGIASWLSATGADAARWPLASMLGFSGLFSSWLGQGTGAQVLAVFGGAAGFAVCVALGLRLRGGAALEPCLAAATLLSVVGSPHLLTQDLALLAPMLVVTLAWASRREAPAVWPGAWSRAVLGGWLLLGLAAAVDLGAQQPAPPGRVVPLALVALAGGLAWQVRRGRGGIAGSLAAT